MRESIAVVVAEPSQTGEARRTALRLADQLGFQETGRGKVGIVVTELATNVLQHADGGILLIQAIEQSGRLGLEILALDQGPGMEDVATCLEDGFSTADTLGNGLGAIHRLSDGVEIYSLSGKGTAILAQFWAAPMAPTALPLSLEMGVLCLPKQGEEVSGDAWASQVEPHRSLFLVSDGLGHGPAAAIASAEAVRVFQHHPHQSPQALLEAAHAALRSTRGAALAIAEIDLEQASICFAGVGNIAASVFSPTAHHNLMSYNGTVGHEVRKVREFTYPWQSSGLLIMHSDGLSSQWRLERYPGLSQKHPSLIAGVLYRDFNRVRDDVTVLVVRGTEP